MRYRAFLSYSHRDRKAAGRLHRALEGYRPPKPVLQAKGLPENLRLAPIFRDRDELPSSHDLSQVILDALAESDALVVVCSPHAAESQWVNEEIRSYRGLGRGHRIYCYIIDGEPGSQSGDECFPPALLEPEQGAAVVPEPVAADARRHGDGRRFAMLKIAAALLGVGFDELRQRDLRRRQRRLVAATVGAVVFAGIMLALAVNSILARNEADRRRAQSEELVNFMLVDLQKQAFEAGRPDLTLGIAAKADAYFSSLPEEDFDDNALSQKALGLRQSGEALIDQGKLSEALPPLFESLLIAERLSNIRPEDTKTQIELSNSYFYVGHVHFLRGEMTQARTYFEATLPIVDNAVSSEPQNAEWLKERGYAYTNMGRILELEGLLDRAHGVYERVMETNMRLHQLAPDNREWELEVGFAHNNLGKLLVALGNLKNAREHYRADVEIKERIYKSDTSKNEWRNYHAVSQFFYGQILAAMGDLQEAEDRLTAAKSEFGQLKTMSPDAAYLDVRLARVDRELADVYWAQGDIELAASHAKSSIARLDRLSATDTSNVSWQRDLADSIALAADLARRNGNPTAISAYLGRGAPIAERLYEQEPDNIYTQRIYINMMLIDALANANTETAQSSARNVLNLLQERFSASRDPHVLELRVLANRLLQRDAESSDDIEKLAAIGFVSRRIL